LRYFAVADFENIGEQLKQSGVFGSAKTASSDRADSHNQIQSNLINNHHNHTKVDGHQKQHYKTGQAIIKITDYRLNSTFC
jgi:hypothetical protein